MRSSISGALVVLGILFTVCSCAPRALPQWEYERNAINLHIEADNQLNLRDGASHTLSLCVYQLKDPNAFNQLVDDADGLYQLLECGIFDSGVAVTKRLIIHPNEELDVTLDRAEGAKYVAIVAGYYTIEKDRIVRFYKIPTAKRGIIRRRYVPKTLDIHLNLGPKQILTPKGE